MANPHLDTPWTEERVEELRRLWAEGYSASEIARQLGAVSRCAISGKINRLGLSRRKPPQPRKPIEQTVKRGRPARRRLMFVFDASPAALPPRPRLEMRRLPLLELEEHHCHWPFGDPRNGRFYFCAADKELQLPYCPHHMARAFVKSRGR